MNSGWNWCAHVSIYYNAYPEDPEDLPSHNRKKIVELIGLISDESCLLISIQ